MRINTPPITSAYETKLSPGELQGLRNIVRAKLGHNVYKAPLPEVQVVKEDDFSHDTETYRIICGAAQVRVARNVEELVTMIVALAAMEG